MSREAQEYTVNGSSWKIQPWPAMHGLKMQAKLGKILGSAIGDLSISDSNASSNMMHVIEDIFNNIDTDQLEPMIKELLHGVFINGKDATMTSVFNEHFQQNYFELFEGLKAVLEVNLNDIFLRLKDFGGESTEPATASSAQ